MDPRGAVTALEDAMVVPDSLDQDGVVEAGQPPVRAELTFGSHRSRQRKTLS
jgi:hypothetical protein